MTRADITTERDDALTVDQQLSRIIFYFGPTQGAQLLAGVAWATDHQKMAAVQNHNLMHPRSPAGEMFGY